MKFKEFLSSVFVLIILTTDLTALRIPEVCLSEDCIMASATILSSLDKSANPCQNFYQFACGGWIQKALRAPADRFEAIDKLNQNLVLKILDEVPSRSGPNSPPNTANEKARAFYQSCMASKDKYQGTIQDLGAIIQYSGGWTVLNEMNTFGNDRVSFDKRMQILQNELAVNVFFIRGLIRHDGRKRLAIVAGGWNKGLAEMTSKSLFEEPMDNSGNFKHQYLQMMVGIVMELWKVSYVEQQLSQNIHNENLSNNDLNATGINDIEYHYDNAFIDDGSGYPYAFNISDIDDYPIQNSNKNSSSGVTLDSNYSNNYESIRDKNVDAVGGAVNQLVEWMFFRFQWISNVSGCLYGNVVPPTGNRYGYFKYPNYNKVLPPSPCFCVAKMHLQRFP